MSARFGTTDAVAFLRFIGCDICAWTWRGRDVLAVYVRGAPEAWTLATMVHGVLGAPRWDWVGGCDVAYWPDIPYADPDDPDCAGVAAT